MHLQDDGRVYLRQEDYGRKRLKPELPFTPAATPAKVLVRPELSPIYWTPDLKLLWKQYRNIGH